MQRAAMSSAGVTLAVCIVVALGIWTVLGLYDSSQGGRGVVLLSVGLFAVAAAVGSHIRAKRDEDL